MNDSIYLGMIMKETRVDSESNESVYRFDKCSKGEGMNCRVVAV